MKQLSTLDSEQVKSFSRNHRKQKVVLQSYSKERSATFEARLTLMEFELLCNFITDNFNNDGDK